MSPSEPQLYAISVTERVCSAVSLAASSVIIVSFFCSTSFRKPINRLVFYASWGNIMASSATVISQSGIHAGPDSPLCQFQAFFIQWFMPADALWTLAMACNVYLTFFCKYDSDRLRRLEWKYFAFCYGTPFIPAFVYFFIKTGARGKIYGTAILWCWVAPSWDFLRIAVFYGPVWFVIFLTFAIYARTGSVIYKRRRQLRHIGMLDSNADCENTSKPAFSKTTEIRITREATTPNKIFQSVAESSNPISSHLPPSYCSPYSVTIEGGHGSGIPLKLLGPEQSDSHLHRRAMMAEANSAAWAYTKYAMLFFIALIFTWVPSTINRVYALVFPQTFNFPLNYLSSFVLPLQGFWNSIIYVSISWPAFKSAYNNL
ncbi:hypothetical protein P170DRAFT_72529 [Aspergillus steynii IBT 23096]|uniref:G-protein coupled receptors family 2 profile 2 domain-containing protein n=1 Tax=Aspergillus steynii IBT 23096 TaxID=1392250 RepID=A0A2I2FR58_9EURO|nr:uncharacterized protein P170DRAFT_72529 [Aspergillus steynii IBT 23096]PLB43124.1 hypothetical protein P170DRAFT_72529 [Aspergillus steynii IBT 23096]